MLRSLYDSVTTGTPRGHAADAQLVERVQVDVG